MSTINLTQYTTTVQATTTGAPNTIPLLDNSGNLTASAVTVANLISTGNLTAAVSPTQTSGFTAGAYTTYICDTTSAGFTVAFLTASAYPNQTYIFLKISASNTITLTGTTGITSFSALGKFIVVSNGTTWIAG